MLFFMLRDADFNDLGFGLGIGTNSPINSVFQARWRITDLREVRRSSRSWVGRQEGGKIGESCGER